MRFIILDKVVGTSSQQTEHPIVAVAVLRVDDIVAQVSQVARVATVRVVSL